MATLDATPVNAATPPPRAVMLSIKDLAERDGVTKPAVSRKVKQLRKSGLYVELDGQQRVALVHSVQYDDLRKRFDDPSKAQAPVAQTTQAGAAARLPAAPPEGQNESLDEARRVKTWTEAELAKLKLEAEQGLYVPVAQLEAALDRVGNGIIESVDKLLQSSDDLAAVVAQHGVHGLRTALKKLASEMKTEIADALAGMINTNGRAS